MFSGSQDRTRRVELVQVPGRGAAQGHLSQSLRIRSSRKTSCEIGELEIEQKKKIKIGYKAASQKVCNLEEIEKEF